MSEGKPAISELGPANWRLVRRTAGPRGILEDAILAAALFMGLAGPGWSQSPPDKSGVKASVISLPSGAGSIEGLGESFEPQLNTGGSTYGVSIALPPGRAGLAPSIRLSYNSNTGNGVCGIGWSLELGATRPREVADRFLRLTIGRTFDTSASSLHIGSKRPRKIQGAANFARQLSSITSAAP